MATQNVPNHLFEQWMRKTVETTRYPATPPISRNVMINLVSEWGNGPRKQSRFAWLRIHSSRPMATVAATVIAAIVVTTIAAPSVRTGIQTFIERVTPW